MECVVTDKVDCESVGELPLGAVLTSVVPSTQVDLLGDWAVAEVNVPESLRARDPQLWIE